jgi:lysophospholipid acyltransferase (LPLAT)-like uncharacterized protein
MEARVMKIRRPWLIKVAGFLTAWVVRLWVGTVRYRYRPLGPDVDPGRPGVGGRFIYAFWHENLLLPASRYGRPDIWVLVSRHADGEVIAEACRRLRFRLVRGSTARSGGIEAVRRMVRLGREGHLAITPDGPRGPRRRVQPGLVYLAARTGLPIVPVGIAYRRAWRLKSWDRFAIPLPGSAAACVTGEPISVPEEVDRDRLEDYRLRVEEALHRATAEAERSLGVPPSAPAAA